MIGGFGYRLPWFPSLISAADLPPAMPGPGNTEPVQARSPASLLTGQTELAFSEVGRDPPSRQTEKRGKAHPIFIMAVGNNGFIKQREAKTEGITKPINQNILTRDITVVTAGLVHEALWLRLFYFLWQWFDV